jgi:predicted nucleic acid-binding protein
MPLVVDATVFRYLVIAEAVDVLPALFGTVIVPPVVVEELQHEHTPGRIRAWWLTQPPWVHIQAPRLPPDPALRRLGAGEQEAIRLMDDHQALLFMTDDRGAHNAALARGIPVTRTLRVLEMAAEWGLVDFSTMVARLRAAGRVERGYHDANHECVAAGRHEALY